MKRRVRARQGPEAWAVMGWAREGEPRQPSLAVPGGGSHLTQKPDLDSFAAVGCRSPKPLWTKEQEQFDLLGADLT